VRFDLPSDNAFRFMPLLDVIQPYGERCYYVFAFFNVTSLKRNIVFLQKAHDSLTAERDRYRALALGEKEREAEFVGAAGSVLELRREAGKVAAAPVTVLLEGETGTGKEVFARYIHSLGPRKTGPFIKVDCASIPETLLESELFGVEKGAFTGANESKPGRLEAASGGTLFLDELANLNSSTQAKLLNFLQDFTIERLGGTKKITVDARIIGATNKPLKELVDQGLFRADLYYRISTVRFSVPPLRERR
jgi:transcriptional regulator with PAS, ATPase and Fis domain